MKGKHMYTYLVIAVSLAPYMCDAPSGYNLSDVSNIVLHCLSGDNFPWKKD